MMWSGFSTLGGFFIMIITFGQVRGRLVREVGSHNTIMIRVEVIQ